MFGAEKISVSHKGCGEGLSSESIISITQDTDGHIWVATGNGLNRYDGNTFSSFTSHNSGLSGNELNSIASLPSYPGLIFIATQRNGLCKYDRQTGRITSVPEDSILSQATTDVIPSKNGDIWLTHYHSGFELYNPATGKSRTFTEKNYPGLPPQTWTLAEGDNGRLYVGHSSNGLSVVDLNTKHIERYPIITGETELPGNDVFAICIDSGGNVWLGTENGAALFNPITKKITPFTHEGPGSIGAGLIHDIKEMGDGEIWFATSQGGISILDTREYAFSDISKIKFREISTAGGSEGISGHSITSLFLDSFGNKWIGNNQKGLDIISHIDPIFSFVNNSVSNPLSNEITYRPAWGCSLGNNGDIWFGGESVIARVTGDKNEAIALPFRNEGKSSIVSSIAVDNEKLFIGTMELGAWLYYPDKKRFSSIAGLPGQIKDIKIHDGVTWICTNAGIHIIDGNKTVPLHSVNSRLRDMVVECLEWDRHGNLWVGTFGKGITVFDKDYNLLLHLGLFNGFPSNAIHDIKHDNSGRVWIATRNGVAMFPDSSNPHRFIKFPVLERMGVNHVKAIEEDADSCIWMTSNKGIIRIKPSSLNDISIIKPIKGVSSDSFSRNGAMTDVNGNVIFTSSNGSFSINTCDKTDTIQPGKVMVSSLTVFEEGHDGEDNGVAIPVFSGKVSLDSDQNTFMIRFCVNDQALADISEISYNLENLDNVWMSGQSENQAMYRNIPPGKYKFRVKQRILGQEWTDSVSLLTIEIKPPLWLSWWAKLIYVAIAAAIVLLLARLYVKRVNLQQRLKTEVENNRNLESLNEERMRFYTNITHELRTPLTLILGPLEDMVSDPAMPGKYSYKLQMIRDSSHKLLNMINGILEFRKTETGYRRLSVKSGSLSHFIREIGLGYREMNNNKELDIVLDIEDDKNNVLFDSEIITTIVTNIINNSIKYTPKGEIRISYKTVIENSIRYSTIEISDTGYGISKEALPKIFDRYFQANGSHQASGTGIGLSLVKKLADIHNAELSVKSEENKGSTFTVRLLSDCQYPDAIHRDSICDLTSHNNKETDQTENKDAYHVLIVEDNDEIRKYICQSLSGMFRVSTARNGLEGLRIAQNDIPDILISDIMMPEMDGITLCRMIKGNIETNHIPVILLTAKDTISDKEEGYESGADSYITKPFSAKLLLSRIHNILRRRRLLASKLIENIKNQPIEDSISNNAHNGDMPAPRNKPDINDSDDRLSAFDRDFIEKLTSLIKDNIDAKDLGAKFISERLCMSVSTLYRKTRAILNMSTDEYISKIRLVWAAELLVEGNKNITEIAYQVGFSGYPAFAKAFKREYGITASEYSSKYRLKQPSENVAGK